ncbi:MAG: flagellar hook capping FlgD N-terminal domain-containing protein [Alsobacter sp.]
MSTVSNATAAQSATSSASSSSSSSSGGTGSASIANTFDQFLTLLTTQLKNQNPLDPLDTNQFTQELVQFASVEQLIKQNTTLTAILTSAKSQTATNALGFVGKQITADGAATALANGKATWRLTAPRAAAQATMIVKDAQGAEVFREVRSLSAGSQDYVWDGRTNAGGTAPSGTYTISVDAKDVSGTGITVSSEIAGVVDSVDLTGDVPILSIGAVKVPVDKVKTLTNPSAS